ncbi:tRNA 2-thiocytidine biosynthesis TtcA family protein [Velocimicrobium porci]|uniref:tRNA 2-thiocytidine biosynthesis protein TtcA n=1 Tax=Velocimicrobium porci TaxID=2606634 RepID=A0A6L5XV65_9FIRM|nr:tRNA 2-thiocytidine biosynthesis TtcA family protein [Velocimicrobium porci]MSS62514.1 tRNA 2-thiocytidine biosynthesis protein TtcA [Velocimicrobium porci]
MKLQQLYSYTRKALDTYHMIEAHDKIAIGISGGKDSLTLLYALAGLKKFYPIPFELEAISVHLGYDEFDLTAITNLCNQLQIRHTIVFTEISTIIMEGRKEQNPCSLCAKMRKGALNNKAKELGCNKIAYAHHKDDLVETMLLSLLFEGQFYAFPPVTHLERSNLTVIRPLMFINEKDIKGFQNKYYLPICKNPCPVDGHTKREYAKQLIRQLNHDHPGAKDRMFHAIVTGNIIDWPNL